MELHDLQKKIGKILIVSQFSTWVKSERKTAKEINGFEGDALNFYLGNIEEGGKTHSEYQEQVLKSNRFRSIIDWQLSLIMRQIQESNET